MSGTEPAAGKGLATKRRILHGAITRFAEQGFRQTSVAQIARDAEVSAPAVHGYFGSKEDLFRAAFAHDVEDLVAMFRERLSAGTLLGSGATLIPDLLAAVQAHPLVRRMLQGREPERTVELLDLPVVARVRQDLVGAVAAAQAAGLIRDDIPAASLAGALETLILALLLGGVQVGLIGDEQRRAALAAIIFKGVVAIA